MRLSRAKVNYLSRLIVESLDESFDVRLLKSANETRLEVVKIINEEVERDAMINEMVRQKIDTQKRDFPEGGREWDILYRQYYQEAIEKHRPPRE